MRNQKYALAAALSAGALALAGIAALAPSAGASSTTLTATTTMTNRPDSAANGGGNWALDNFTRGASIYYKGAASSSDCGGISPCYAYTGKVSDVGHFTTVTGQPSPGFGYLNGGSDPTMQNSLTGTMSGSQTYAFYTTVPVSGASAANVPASDSGSNYNSGEWPELFFPSGTMFWDSSGQGQGSVSPSGGGELGTGFFKYVYLAKPGSDHDCPNMTSQWLDASPSSGGSSSDGNILAPDASGC